MHKEHKQSKALARRAYGVVLVAFAGGWGGRGGENLHPII